MTNTSHQDDGLLDLDAANRSACATGDHEPCVREGRLLALFDGRCDATSAVREVLQRHGAEDISVEREWLDGLQAIRAAWPVTQHGAMDDDWLRRVVRCVEVAKQGRQVRASLGSAQRVGIFVSKSDHCIADLLQRSRSGALPCEIAIIISNHEDCRALAERYGVPFHHFDLSQPSKACIEIEQLALLDKAQVDLIVLARYMQVLSPAFVARYHGRIINIHHALLPAFEGADPYGRALARGVKYIGATAHYVTETLDGGPIIEQEVVRVTHRDDGQALRRKGANVERITLARAVHLHLDARVLPVNGRVVVFAAIAARHEAMQEGSAAAGPVAHLDTDAGVPVGAQHWLTTEWPSSELQRSLPEVFPTRPAAHQPQP